jgi:hypothetical protein
MCKVIQQYTYHSAFTHVCIISERIHTHCGRVQHFNIRFLCKLFHSHGKCKESNVLSILWYNVSVFMFAYVIASKNDCAAFCYI